MNGAFVRLTGTIDGSGKSQYGLVYAHSGDLHGTFETTHQNLVVVHLHRGGEGIEPLPGTRPMTTHLPATGWVF